MNLVAGSLFSGLFFAGISINKYVLSVLGFKYPTIFQGWQTLAGLVIYKLLNVFNKPTYAITNVDRAGFISIIPGLLFYTTALVANSKALSLLPVCVFLAVQNTVPAGVYLFERISPNPSRQPTAPLQFLGASSALLTGLGLVIGETSLNFSDTGYFWLLVGVVCNAASFLHARIADARFKSWDRLYYSSVFAVVLLAPASLYLEEAFQALQFHHDRQELFLTGCLFSAIFTAAINVYSVRLKEDEYFGLVQNLSVAGTAALSTIIFDTNLKLWQWILVGVNLVSTIPLPAHQTKDEDEKPLIIQNA